MPLALTNTRAALINPVLSAMWALGAYLIARWSDARGSPVKVRAVSARAS